jgi:hypothetical protein
MSHSHEALPNDEPHRPASAVVRFGDNGAAVEVDADGYHGEGRRVEDKKIAAATESATMGIIGNAKQLTNVAAVAVIAAMCCLLLTVVIGVAWIALDRMFDQVAINNAVMERIAAQQQKSYEQNQKREDTIREALLQEQNRQRESQARFAEQFIAAQSKFTSEFVTEMRALTAENRALTTEIKANRISFERKERSLTNPTGEK